MIGGTHSGKNQLKLIIDHGHQINEKKRYSYGNNKKKRLKPHLSLFPSVMKTNFRFLRRTN